MNMRFKSWSIPLAVIAMLIAVTTGLFFSFHGIGDNQMTSCPIMGMPVICDMSVQEHISAWKSIFAAIPGQILLLAALLFLARSVFRYLTFKPPRFLYLKPKLQFASIFNYLQEAFSSGLIHSKVY